MNEVVHRSVDINCPAIVVSKDMYRMNVLGCIGVSKLSLFPNRYSLWPTSCWRSNCIRTTRVFLMLKMKPEVPFQATLRGSPLTPPKRFRTTSTKWANNQHTKILPYTNTWAPRLKVSYEHLPPTEKKQQDLTTTQCLTSKRKFILEILEFFWVQRTAVKLILLIASLPLSLMAFRYAIMSIGYSRGENTNCDFSVDLLAQLSPDLRLVGRLAETSVLKEAITNGSVDTSSQPSSSWLPVRSISRSTVSCVNCGMLSFNYW